MLQEVVKTWLKVLQPLEENTLITKTYGLVRPGRISVASGRDFVFPVVIDQKLSDVVQNHVDDGLLINKSQRSVVFVKGNKSRTVRPTDRSRPYELFPVMLVAWYNKNGFQTTSGNIATKFTSAIAKLIEGKHPGIYEGYQGISFERTDISVGWECFREYSFREQSAYLFDPYDAVGITGNLKFYLNENDTCQSDILPTDFSSDC